ncbi:hypothetical protein ABT095_24065 [Kitasatospora sp. NPDC002227]|uniref:hypothetical protein n=1 Tax=Kitasatospora sp. NPDC002227 TaxID=3154773 RepID=UPI003316D034
MTDVFEQELLEQLAEARRAQADARAAGDLDGVDAYRGRITGLLHIAARYGIRLPHTPEEEEED